MAVMMRIINEVPDVTGVPDSLRPVIVECLDKDPARRPKARDIMLRLVDTSTPYPQQTLATPAGQGVPGFPVDSVPLDHLPTHMSSPSGLAPGTGPAAAAFDPRTGPVPELPGPTPPGFTPPGYTPSGPPAGPRRSRRGLAVAAGSAAAVVVLAVVGVLLLTKGSPPTSPSGTSSSSPPA